MAGDNRQQSENHKEPGAVNQKDADEQEIERQVDWITRNTKDSLRDQSSRCLAIDSNAPRTAERKESQNEGN
jgi:hypothetical protein